MTIDPASSTDLDQALFIDRSGEGYKVFYAIADVPSFVAPGGALDAETRRRGQTFYTPDGRIPLHPEVISEEAGSLLAGQLCAAFVWEFELDAAAEVSAVLVRRATVRSRAKLSYRGVQAELDAGTAAPVLQLLKEVGIKRVELERLRGGASLNMPEQEIEQLPDGGYRIVAAPPLPVEDWNAQISLMTGMAAAGIMLAGKVGILRTMPAPDEASLAHFHRQTRALGKPWDGEMSYGEYLRTLDPTDPRQLAIVHSAGMLFRGAGYTPFDGTVPEAATQAAIGAAYAHSTAPLRRLIDRFVLVICEALSNGTAVPAWAREALPVPSRDHGGLGPAGRQAGAALPRHRRGGAAGQPHRPGVRRRRDLRFQTRPERKERRTARTGTATEAATATDPPGSCRSPSLRSPPAAPANWNPAPRSGCGLCPPTLPPARSGWSWWAERIGACSRARSCESARSVEDPGRVQLDWKGRYGCPVVDFLDFRIQQARPYAILR